jgi:hypothetical protein
VEQQCCCVADGGDYTHKFGIVGYNDDTSPKKYSSDSLPIEGAEDLLLNII